MPSSTCRLRRRIEHAGQRLRRWPVRYGGLVVIVGWAVPIVLAVLLVWWVPPLLYGHVPDLNQRAADEASTRTALIAALVGLTALRTYRLTQQGQITDRYTQAVEQLGADKLTVRLGSIYALERIAVDSKRDHQTIVEVLSAFVREHADPARTDSTARESNKQPAADVQAAVTVLGRLPHQKGVNRGDLRGVLLMGVELQGVNLSGALFFDANLSGAGLYGANLSSAKFLDTNLSYAVLYNADLSNACLFYTDLSHANLRDANLSDARFHGTDLADAELQGANLSGAKGLTQEQLNTATGNALTQLPHGVRRPSAW